MEVSYFGYEQLGYGPNFEVALNMPLEQLKFYCVNNELFRKICSDQEFWFRRLQREYSTLIQYKPINMTYGQYYTALVERIIKIVIVEHNDQKVNIIPMFHNDDRGSLVERALNSLDNFKCDLDTILRFKKFNKLYSLMVDTVLHMMMIKSYNYPVDFQVFFGENLWNDLDIINITCGEPPWI
jgi:hypothetical protein